MIKSEVCNKTLTQECQKNMFFNISNMLNKILINKIQRNEIFDSHINSSYRGIVFSVDLVCKEELNLMLVEASQGAVDLS